MGAVTRLALTQSPVSPSAGVGLGLRQRSETPRAALTPERTQEIDTRSAKSE